MIADAELIKRLSFLDGQPKWVLREVDEEGRDQVLSPPVIPKATGFYWIAGETTLCNGRRLASVFCVDTDSGGELYAVSWKIEGDWYRHDDAEALRRLGLERDDAFPFDWSFAVPLEEDVFHPVPDAPPWRTR